LLRDFVKIKNSDANTIFTKITFHVFLYNYLKESLRKLSITFFNLRYKYKIFNEFLTTKLLANFHNFDILRKKLNF